jgi:hypothetical protein
MRGMRDAHVANALLQEMRMLHVETNMPYVVHDHVARHTFKRNRNS